MVLESAQMKSGTSSIDLYVDNTIKKKQVKASSLWFIKKHAMRTKVGKIKKAGEDIDNQMGSLGSVSNDSRPWLFTQKW